MSVHYVGEETPLALHSSQWVVESRGVSRQAGEGGQHVTKVTSLLFPAAGGPGLPWALQVLSSMLELPGSWW